MTSALITSRRVSSTEGHESVFLREAIDALEVHENDVVVDATLGGAGHFAALLGKLDASGTLVGIDADADAVARARCAAEGASARIELFTSNFRHLGALLDAAHIERVDKVLFDLGWSSYHLTSGRGFSFQVDEPLLMTYGEPEEGKTAADVVNSTSESDLADIIFNLGEERFARQIARGITDARSRRRILTTKELCEVIEASTPSWYHHRRINPATKTFQALRMYVNDELGALRDALAASLERLSEGGRVAVITFHSIEDRIVKNMLRDAAYEGKGLLVTRKPMVPSAEECAKNPRARSAKLRVFERASESL